MNKFYTLKNLTLCFLLPLLLAGCMGGVTEPTNRPSKAPVHSTTPAANRIPVIIGTVTNLTPRKDINIQTVQRYLVDATVSAISDCGNLQYVADAADASDATSTNQPPDATPWKIDVEILQLEEKAGATFKIGVLSSQSQQAVAKLRTVLRSGDNSRKFESTQTATSSKGSWGVISAVNRDALIKGEGVWKMDQTMLGNACREALEEAVRHVAAEVKAP